VARLAEQFARYHVSQVLFDIKGDLTSLVTDRRPDGRPFVPNGFVGGRGRAPRGRSVLHRGGQVVYDLRTWQTPEQMADTICAIVEEMLETVALTPEGELAPCLVFLDEAEYWLPQGQPSYLSGRTYKRLLDAFHMLATMGRSRGLAPVIATQRIAKVNSEQRGPLLLELQDDGAVVSAMEAMEVAPVPSADQSIRRVTAPPQVSVENGPFMPALRPAKARLTPELMHALAAYQEGATTARGLADTLKAQGIQCEKDKAASLIRRLRELGEIM
jgi:hypothetical protein